MEDRITQCNGEASDTLSRISSEDGRLRRAKWTNGQCVLTVPASSMLAPSFDLSLCRHLLEREGFQIPVEDFEAPIRIALDPPSIRRYLFFNSSLFHFILAPVLYIVLWCAVYSSLHQYLDESNTDFWVLCLCVSLTSICITTAIILLLHCNNKEINVNTDIRLVQLNERLVKHGLLLGVADWVQQCSGKMQLFCVFWDLAPCLQALTETLEGLGFVKDEIENKLKKRMSHIYIVTDVLASEADDGDEVEPSEETDEEQPLLVETRPRNNSQKQRDESKLTKNYSLVPDCTRSYQAIAYQLLLTYSAVYVRLLVSERLPASSHRPLGRNHCTTASFCLCQFVQHKVLR